MAKKPTYEELEQRVKELENEAFEHKKAAEELIKNEKLYKEAQSLAHIGHWDYEPHEDSLTWSDELYSIFEIDKDAGPLSIEVFIERIHPEDRDTIRGQIEKGEGYRSEYRIVMDNGSVKHIREEVLIVRQEDDKILITKGTAQDITKQKQTQEALRESEQKYRQLLNHAPAGIYEIDFAKQKFVDVNDVICEYTGYTREEMLSMSPFDILTEDSKRVFAERIGKLFAGETIPETVELKVRGKNGREFWILLNNNFLYENEKPKGATVVVHDITARKQAEAVLRERDERYTALFDRSLDCIYIHDLEGNFIDANPAALKLFGYTKEEILSLNFASLLSQDQMSLALQTLEKIKKDGFQKDVAELKVKKKNGEQIYIEAKASLLYHEGEPYAIQGIGRDTTDRKRAEEALQESEEKARQYLDIAGVAFVALDNEGNIALINQRGLEILGYQREELLGKNWFKTCLPDRFKKDILDVYHQLIRGKVEPVEYYENPVLTKDGQERIIAWHNSVLRNPDGEIVGSLSSGEDITEHVLAEEALRESEGKFRSFAEQSLVGIYLISDDVFKYVNPKFAEIFGYSVDECLDNMHFRQLVHPEDLATVQKQVGRRLSGETKSVRYSFRGIKKSGDTIHVEIFGASMVLKGKGVATGTMLDITKSKRAEEALKESEGRLKKAQSVAKLGNWDYDISTGKIWGSEQAFRIYGIERTSPYLPLDRVEACIPDAPRVGQALVDLIQENKRYDIEFEVQQEVSRQTILIHSIAELVYENGMPVKVLGVIQDVTEQKKAEKERKHLEDQLQHAQKMEAIGMLAGGVAHDLNNILGGLVSYPELLLLQLPEDSPLRKSILTIQKSGEKAAAVVQDLLTLARRGVVVTEVVNLNDVISEYLKSPEHENLQSYHPGVHLETHLATDTLNILGSSTHLSKTVMNLVSNADEAIPLGGKIIVSTENRYIDRPIRGYDDVKEGDYVVLTISDTGTGISPDDMEKIFELFYTKKKMGRSGTGLGMSVVWGTVKDHKGYIDVQSTEGRGTTFTLYFPVTRKLLEERSEISLKDSIGKGEAILVVDDVEEQRQIASGMLKELGYSVISVSSGEEAVEYLKTNKVDLLLLDMIMDPGMDGLDTYKKILELHPGQKAIIASGFSETDRVKKVQSLGAGVYIRKPFLLEKIGIAVKEELEK